MATIAGRSRAWTMLPRIVAIAACLGLAPVGAAWAQEPNPSPAPTGLPPSEIDSSAPHLQTIAQGVIGLEGPVAWRVREVSLLGSTAPETGGFSFVLQRTGTELIRNELTGRRTRLEAGEAYFMSTGDPFVRTAVGDEPVVAWFIEMVNPREPSTLGLQGGTVLLTTEEITDYPAGSFDVELRRGVLLPDESAIVPGGTNPMLLLVTTGRVQVTTQGDAPPETVSAGTGQLVYAPFTITNEEPQAAVVAIAAVGDAVEGAEVPITQPTATAAAPAPAPAATTAPQAAAPTPSPTQPSQAPSGGDADSDNLPDDLEAQYGSDPLNPDFDGDGIADGDEVNTYGTDPASNDTDGDGLLDGEEVFQFGTSPVSTDTDRDGLSDADEIYTYGTNPVAIDTDGDTVPDGEEVLIYGTNPLDSASAP